MSARWSQAAMLLLGVTLTVGFYEGRQLVRDTVQAFSAVADDAPEGPAVAPRSAAAAPALPAAPAVEAPDVPAAAPAEPRKRSRAERRRRRAERLAEGPSEPADDIAVPEGVDDLFLAVDPEQIMEANRLDMRAMRRRARMVRRAGAGGPREAVDLQPLGAQQDPGAHGP